MKAIACRALVVSLAVAWAAVAGADIILSASGLNAALKKMELLKQRSASGTKDAQAQALFDLGVEADALAELLNDEVAAHGSQEKALIDLAIARSGELGVSIAYNREKKKFFYDNAAFRQYAAGFPRGRRIAEAEFKILEGEYFQSTGSDIAAVNASAARKQAFLARHPAFAGNSEVSLMLSIDYRDLYRHYRTANDAAARDRYLALTRQQLAVTASRYKGTEPATIAARILERFNEEVRNPPREHR
jgi:hypothetical protein